MHFTGKQRDTEAGLDNFGARYNASGLGRFMTPDWSAKVEPVPYAKLGDPQTLNLYAYVTDNPTTLTDPTGHTAPPSTEDDAGFAAASLSCDLVCLMDNPLYGMALYDMQLVNMSHKEVNAAKKAQAQYHLSKEGLDFIKKREGKFYSHVYDASGKKHLGDWTIGYGHKVLNPKKYSKGITKAQGVALLKHDVATAVAGVNQYATAPLGQNQVDALVSFTFNVGVHGFSRSSLRADVALGNRVPERDFTLYDRSKGRFSPGLLERRRAEYALYTSW